MSNKNWKYILYRSIWGGLDLVFPPFCGGCRKPGSRWCEDCQKKVQILNGILCDVCGLPQNKAGVCDICFAVRPHFRALRAWAIFDDPLRSALHKLKYGRDLSLGDSLAGQMISFVLALNWPINVIVPIPPGKRRLRDRGYNQVGMIARPLVMALDVHYFANGLMRQKETRSQVGLTKQEREENVRDAFAAHAGLKGKNVFVMDDVSTTGSTLSSSADALFLPGAKEVYAFTVARALRLEHA